jgi:hypothetical protein
LLSATITRRRVEYAKQDPSVILERPSRDKTTVVTNFRAKKASRQAQAELKQAARSWLVIALPQGAEKGQLGHMEPAPLVARSGPSLLIRLASVSKCKMRTNSWPSLDLEAFSLTRQHTPDATSNTCGLRAPLSHWET